MGLLQYRVCGVSVTDILRYNKDNTKHRVRGMVHNRTQLVGETEAIQTVPQRAE